MLSFIVRSAAIIIMVEPLVTGRRHSYRSIVRCFHQSTPILTTRLTQCWDYLHSYRTCLTGLNHGYDSWINYTVSIKNAPTSASCSFNFQQARTLLVNSVSIHFRKDVPINFHGLFTYMLHLFLSSSGGNNAMLTSFIHIPTFQLLQHETPHFTSADLWPPNSPGLNRVDYWICGLRKERVYKTRPRHQRLGAAPHWHMGNRGVRVEHFSYPTRTRTRGYG